MKPHHPKQVLMAILLLLCLASPTQAADFTINVKVNAQKLHQDVTTFSIKCRVGTGSGSFNADNTIGMGETEIPRPASGTIDDTIAVAFDADAGKNPAEATRYHCHAVLIGPNGTFAMAGPASSAPDYAKVKAGEPNRSALSGTISQ